MSDKNNFDEKEVFKPMAKPEFDYEKFYPKLMENYCTALSRIEELESLIREAVEVYAGMEGFVPETCPEGYCLQIIEQMAKALMADAVNG